MKKKIFATAIILCLFATAIVSGTLAYFTDTAAEKNVMTSGHVDIWQNEDQREGDVDAKGDFKMSDAGKLGTIETFEDGKTIVPAVYYDNDNKVISTIPDRTGKIIGQNGNSHNVWCDNVMNEVDKIISVSNKGTEPVYVRTIIAFEECDPGKTTLTEQLNIVWSNTDKQSGENKWVAGDPSVVPQELLTITVDGTNYILTVCTYKTELDAGETSDPSLLQFWLKPEATNESWSKKLGTDGEYTILALSQAVQADGFNDAQTALNAAFGEVNYANKAEVEDWFRNIP